ncbi:DoxX family protein [Saccharopolyspora sp. NPDC003752]
MAPLIILLAVTLVLLVAGAVGVRGLRPWPVAVRGGLAAMFVATGIAHFVGMREQLISMVPPVLPEPGLLVTVTGILELMGAAGLLWHRTAPWAAGGLGLMLIAMFPANVYAALEGILTAADDQLVPRTAMQVVFLAATAVVVVHHVRARNGRATEAN